MSYVKVCPRCGEKRGINEMVCGASFQGSRCNWSLLEVLPSMEDEEPEPIVQPVQPARPIAAVVSISCANGHPMEDGDFMCAICGESPSEGQLGDQPVLGNWTIVEQLDNAAFLVERKGERGIARYHEQGAEPDSAIYAAIRNLDPGLFVRLLDHGRSSERTFEVWEYFPTDLGAVSIEEKADFAFVYNLVGFTAPALRSLEDAQVVLRNLTPRSLFTRSQAPMEFALGDFRSAVLGGSEIRLGNSIQGTKYSAPETFAGVSSHASDWWSLGVILLEMLTKGAAFESIHERALTLHIVTRGLSVPSDLPREWSELLRGLLTRDPSRRWGWNQVSRWIAGERGIPSYFEGICQNQTTGGNPIQLGSRSFFSPSDFALGAADASNWDQAREILLDGRIVTWLGKLGERDRAIQIRALTSNQDVPEDAKLAGSLLALNENLPLCCRGEIITRAWILTNPTIALNWVDSPLPAFLKSLQREMWFVSLRDRADRIRSRIQDDEIEVESSDFSAALLATSRKMLETRWRERRRLHPEADHPSLSFVADKVSPSDEDLIILLSAQIGLFRTAEEVLEEVLAEATAAGIAVNREEIDQWFFLSRREVLIEVDDRIANFVRCGISLPDQWADEFRQHRQLRLARALVVLSIPKESWKPLPNQEYVGRVLDHLNRRLVAGLQRGGLVRMTISTNSSKLDLTELGGAQRSAEDLVSAILRRRTQLTAIDPEALQLNPKKNQRLRRLFQNATTYKRETGIDSLFVGFPFIVLKDPRASEVSKPRIAPVLLWPVQLEVDVGRRAVAKIGYDSERNAIEINPSLEGILGGEYPKWREVLDDLRGRENLELSSVMEALGALLAGSQSTTRNSIVPLPPKTAKVPVGETQLHASAVVFLCDFSGQTISQDLRQLTRRPIEKTALSTLIRLNDTESSDERSAPPSEVDRYFVANSDPTQQAAVFRSRNNSGLVIQGPPGTGKSQTIVNIVSDSIGRNKTVLIVCQKNAALEVVRKRLDAEGLSQRLFLLQNPVSDRKPTIRALRDQIQSGSHSDSTTQGLQRDRESLALQIDSLEKELNDAHTAAYQVPPLGQGRCTYREIHDRFLEIQVGETAPVEARGLGKLLADLDYPFVDQMTARIAPLCRSWLESKFEENPSHVLSYFQCDTRTVSAVKEALISLKKGEGKRSQLIKKNKKFYRLEETSDMVEWLSENESTLSAMTNDTASLLARWANVFSPTNSKEDSVAEKSLASMEQLEQSLTPISKRVDNSLFEKVAATPEKELKLISQRIVSVAEPSVTFFQRMNPAKWFSRSMLNNWLKGFGKVETIDLGDLAEAIKSEFGLRENLKAVEYWCTVLQLPVDQSNSLPANLAKIRSIIDRLKQLCPMVRRIYSCPFKQISEELVSCGSTQKLNEIIAVIKASMTIFDSRQESKQRLESLKEWFEADFIQEECKRYESYDPKVGIFDELERSLVYLPAFQEFRVRARNLEKETLQVLKQLRSIEHEWLRFTPVELAKEITRTIWNEALTTWARQAELRCPSLLMEQAELEEKVRLLERKDGEMRQLNKELLRKSTDSMGRKTEWDQILALTGARSLQLREIIDRGERLGLFQFRPIWLVNPEMVSRIFPLREGLFDLVIFDEASQLPVETSVPALFRARRVVVSGDEKQMPPSHFFGAQLDVEDDDEENHGDNEESSDQEIKANSLSRRRDVINSTDLLSLSQNCLPKSTLEIHYRSRYPQLIDYSNAAFYGGSLNVPARHPEVEIKRAKPIEVDRVEGIYRDQTNDAEACRVVDRLRTLWQLDPIKRPSVGVVTFNIKQADLIEEKLETLAETDEAFRTVLLEERARLHQGENVGFFVKNLENVQGDERDYIIFSTTFGRDPYGLFRRSFGVLGQSGGERRLNVAITRARLKIILLTSMPVNEVSDWRQRGRLPSTPRDYLQGWLGYAEQISREQYTLAQEMLLSLREPSLFDDRSGSRSRNSVFIDQVRTFLKQRGYDPTVGAEDAFGVDFAILNPETGHFGLGIECDSPNHPILESARSREIWRPKVLKDSIPVLHRITCRGWYLNRRAEEDRLLRAIGLALGS